MAPVLQRALPIVASALGRKLGVRVEVSGRRACTDGASIWLPAFDPKRPEQERLCWGYLAHEAAHVRYTDFMLDYDGSALRKRLTNLLEDVRIEKTITQEYPGAAFSLSEVVRQLVATGRLGAPAKSDSPVKVLHDALLAILRFEILGQKVLEQEAAKAHEVMKASFAEQTLDSLRGLLAQVSDLNSTKAARDLADQVITLFQSLSHDDSDDKGSGETATEEPENSSGAQTTDSQDSGSQNQQDLPDSLSGEELESESVQGEQEEPENLPGENGDASDKAEAPFLKQILECTEEDWPEDLFQSVAKEMEDWSGQQGGGLSAVTTTPQVDEVVVSEEDREAGKELLWKVQSESARLAAQLTGLVQAKTLTRDRTGKRGTRLDGRRLHRVALDDGRLFKRRSESISTDAAIHISLDISSSMSPRMALARESVLALVVALKRVNGVKVSASAYPGSCEDRVYPIILNDRSALDTAMTLSGLDSYDSTPMATGLWRAVHQVLEENANRRLILMVTDGGPDIDHHRPVVDLVRRCGQSGIDVVGLGISVQTVAQLFPRSLVVDRLDQLKSSLFDLVKKWL
ncbi:MAG: hypothetical protein ACR2PT_05605 [Endozoicomonas sp.]